MYQLVTGERTSETIKEIPNSYSQHTVINETAINIEVTMLFS